VTLIDERPAGEKKLPAAKYFLKPSINMYRDFACDIELTMRYSVAREIENDEERKKNCIEYISGRRKVWRVVTIFRMSLLRSSSHDLRSRTNDSTYLSKLLAVVDALFRASIHLPCRIGSDGCKSLAVVQRRSVAVVAKIEANDELVLRYSVLVLFFNSEQRECVGRESRLTLSSRSISLGREIHRKVIKSSCSAARARSDY
jgi:hypothetical protein